MKHLLHCIVQQNSAKPSPRADLYLVGAQGLAAVVSRVEESRVMPSVSSVLAFERIVEDIHAGQAVIPMRYGCLMESEPAIVRHLEGHREEYEALFLRLHGMTEMGIRILQTDRARPARGSSSSPGTAYLSSLRNRYGPENNITPEESQLADQIVGVLADCHTEQRREISRAETGQMLSLYFLTLSTRVESFRHRTSRLCLPKGMKLLVSGPWPPYNFVGSRD